MLSNSVPPPSGDLAVRQLDTNSKLSLLEPAVGCKAGEG